MLKIYVKQNCPHCEGLLIPEGVDVEKIDIEEYGGFRPSNVPVMQIDGINYEGPHVINSMMNLIQNSINGEYSK